MTDHREDWCVDPGDAQYAPTWCRVEEKQKRFRREFGLTFLYLATSGTAPRRRPFLRALHGFPQLENGSDDPELPPPDGAQKRVFRGRRARPAACHRRDRALFGRSWRRRCGADAPDGEETEVNLVGVRNDFFAASPWRGCCPEATSCGRWKARSSGSGSSCRRRPSTTTSCFSMTHAGRTRAASRRAGAGRLPDRWW